MSATPFRGDVQRIADGFAAAVRARDDAAAARLVAAYSEIRQRLDLRYRTLIAEIGRQRMSGAEVDALLKQQLSWAAQLLAESDRELIQWAQQAAGAITVEQRAAVAAAERDQEKLARLSLQPAPQGASVRFRRLPKEAINELVGTLADGSPLADLLDSYGKAMGQATRSALVRGLAEGLNPRDIAREMRAGMDGNAVRALTVARSETLRAYRESSRRWMAANDDVIGSWLWWSALDQRTCPVCFAMHGSKHSFAEPMGTHPNCRCTMIPVTKTWKELGFGDVPGDGELSPKLGADEFAALPNQAQRAILGPSKYALYRRGKLELADLVEVVRHPRWGVSRRERSLRDILADEMPLAAD